MAHIYTYIWILPARPAPPAAGCAEAGTGCPLPERRGCTGSSGSLLVPSGSLWSASEKAPSWPGSADPWSAEYIKSNGYNIMRMSIDLFFPPFIPSFSNFSLTTTASAVVPSELMTAGALLITAVVKGACMVLVSWANSACFFLMC